MVLKKLCCLLDWLVELFWRCEGEKWLGPKPLSVGFLGVCFRLVLRNPCCLLDWLVKLFWR